MEDWQVAELTEFAHLLAEHGSRTGPVGPRADPGAGALADLPRESLLRRWRGAGPPGQAGLGSAAGVPRSRVRIYEHTEVTKITSNGAGLALRCPFGTIRGRQVALLPRTPSPTCCVGSATTSCRSTTMSWSPNPSRRSSRTPLAGRAGRAWLISATSSTITGSRPTTGSCGADDVIYHFGNRIGAEQDQRLATHAALAEQFFTTFPQLEGLRFTHRWGGVIDTCSRFTTFWGRAYRDRLAYAVGYTGLGVGASRFGAESCSTFWMAQTTSARGSPWCEPSQSPSHPSPCWRDPADPMVDRSCRP